MKKGGVNGALQSLPLKPSRVENPSGRILGDIKFLKDEIQKSSEELVLAFTAADLEKVHKRKKYSLMLGLEYFHGMLEGDVNLIDTYYSEGIRSITLFNGWKDQIYKKPEEKNKKLSLTPFGKNVIARMNQLGMVIDITHLSEDVQYNVINTSRAPIMASHSNVRAIVPHRMNLSDRIIKMMAEKVVEPGLKSVRHCR